MTDPEVIAALGGHAAVAEYVGVTRENALHWTRGLIPFRYRHKVKEMARRKRITLPADFLDTRRKVAA